MFAPPCLRFSCFTPDANWSAFKRNFEDTSALGSSGLPCCLGFPPPQRRGAAAPSEPVQAQRRKWTTASRCPAGHRLKPWAALRGSCNACGRLVRDGEQVMDCRQCNFYLCESCRPHTEARSMQTIEKMMQELFRLHDLNSNGFLEEDELVQLNTKVAMLHHGKDADLKAVKEKYRTLFREKLDPGGRPVPYPVFRRYVVEVLDGLDPDPRAQEMVLEQFAAEARSARAVFNAPSFASASDMAFQSSQSMHSNSNMDTRNSGAGAATFTRGVMYGGG